MSTGRKFSIGRWIWAATAVGTYACAWIHGGTVGVGIVAAGLICTAIVGWRS